MIENVVWSYEELKEVVVVFVYYVVFDVVWVDSFVEMF